MSPQKPYYIALLAIFMMQNACSRDPLGIGPSEAALAATQGSVVVTLYQGAALATASPAQRIAMLRPDGSRSEALTAQGAFAGQPKAQFSGLTQAGTYRFGLADQPSRTPRWTSLTLQPGTQALDVPLQLSGSALTVTDAVAAQGNDFKYISGSWSYNVAWSNSTAMQSDLAMDLDPSTVPTGWSYSFNPAVLQAGQSSVLTVNYAEACLTSTVNLQVRGLVGSNTVGLATRSLNKNWTMDVLTNFTTPPGTSNAPYSVGAWWTVPMTITVRVVGTNLPVGAFANVDLPLAQLYSSSTDTPNCTLIGCGWNDAAQQNSAGTVAVLVNDTNYVALNAPTRAWLNTGWTMKQNFDCLYGKSQNNYEYFNFRVHLGSSDLSFTKIYTWPYN